MSIFTKLFGRSTPERDPKITPQVEPPTQEEDELDEATLARREESLAKMSDWLRGLTELFRDVREEIKAHTAVLSNSEQNSRAQLTALNQMTQTMRAQNDTSAEIAEHMKSLPRLAAFLPEATRTQTEILEKMSVEIGEQSIRSKSLLEIFREISEKLEKLPEGEEEQVRLLKDMAKNLEEAADEERRLRYNLESLQELLRGVTESMKSQVESIEVIERTQRTSLAEMTRSAEMRGKQVTYLLLALAILLFVFGIWALSTLSDIKSDIKQSLRQRPTSTVEVPESGR